MNKFNVQFNQELDGRRFCQFNYNGYQLTSKRYTLLA